MTLSVTRRILHVDVDAFFASVEQVLEPRLRGRPVIVGGRPGDRRGVVASASYEAREKGVRSAMPLAEARRLCPEAECVRGHYEAYGDFSRRILSVLREFCPVVEAVSLDDFYLDATGLEGPEGPALAERIRERVKAETGLSVSVGIGTSRLVAKMASGFAKPDGIAEVWPGYEAAFLRPMKAGDLHGVGPATAEKLRKLGLHTVGQVAGAAALLEREFGEGGRVLAERARGIDPTPVAAEEAEAKSISHETTFERDTLDRRVLEAALHELTERVCARLRRHGLAARRVGLKARYADFTTVTRSRTLPAATDHDDEVFAVVLEALAGVLKRGMRLRLVGVAASGLRREGGRQGDFLEGEQRSKRSRLYAGIDAVRRRQGFDAIVAGRAVWRLSRREKGRGKP